jgi:hypothetical protein
MSGRFAKMQPSLERIVGRSAGRQRRSFAAVLARVYQAT